MVGNNSHDELIGIYVDDTRTFNLIVNAPQYSFSSVGSNTYGRAYVVDVDSPAAPKILTPTARQYFKTTPIRTTWTQVTDPSDVATYQVAYSYDAAHSFDNSTCPNETIGAVAVYCRDTTSLSRNHEPGLNEEGGVTIWVRAIDGAGNVSPWSTSVHYYYDHTAPSSVVTSLNNGDFIKANAQGNLVVTGTATDNLALNRVQVQLLTSAHGAVVGVPVGSMSLVGTGMNADWQTSFNVHNLNGQYVVSVKSVDMAGNVEGAYYINFIIDTVAPQVESVKINNVALPSNRYFRTTVNVTATVESSEANMKSHWFEITGPNGYDSFITTGLNEGGNSYGFAWDTTGLTGQYSIRYVATDQAGNRSDDPNYSNPYIVTVNLDNTAPVGQLNTIAGKDLSAGKPIVRITNNQLEVDGTATDNQALNRIGVQLVKVGVSGGLQYVYANNNTLYGTTGTINWTAIFNTTNLNLQDGEYAINVSYVDKIGNVSTETVLFTLDNTATTQTADVAVAVAPPVTTPTTTITPAITSPAAVLGATTDNSTTGDTGIKGATDNKIAAAVNSDANKGTVFGLAWYWWILILAALALIGWFIAGAIRRRNEANS